MCATVSTQPIPKRGPWTYLLTTAEQSTSALTEAIARAASS